MKRTGPYTLLRIYLWGTTIESSFTSHWCDLQHLKCPSWLFGKSEGGNTMPCWESSRLSLSLLLLVYLRLGRQVPLNAWLQIANGWPAWIGPKQVALGKRSLRRGRKLTSAGPCRGTGICPSSRCTPPWNPGQPKAGAALCTRYLLKFQTSSLGTFWMINNSYAVFN